MLASDLIGAIAGLALAYPAGKDQYFRYMRELERAKAKAGPIPRFREIVAAGWEAARSDYDGIDSLLLALGGAGLFLSFILKCFGK